MLKHGFEKEFNCEACTPLGILGHELDLASQAQNNKIVSQVLSSAKFDAEADLASPFVRVTEGAARASCQIFGDTAFLSFTLAPETTEDLPQELGRIVDEEVVKHGLKNAIIVNAHNSINDIVDTQEHLDEFGWRLQNVWKKRLQSRLASSWWVPRAFPKEFYFKDQAWAPAELLQQLLKLGNRKLLMW